MASIAVGCRGLKPMLRHAAVGEENLQFPALYYYDRVFKLFYIPAEPSRTAPKPNIPSLVYVYRVTVLAGMGRVPRC